MKNFRNSSLLLLLLITIKFAHAQDDRIVLGYFPSWSESWASSDQNSTLRQIPNFVNYIFLSFAKPDLRYVAGSYQKA